MQKSTKYVATSIATAAFTLVIGSFAIIASPVEANQSFARSTGISCSDCHANTSNPSKAQLTSLGIRYRTCIYDPTPQRVDCNVQARSQYQAGSQTPYSGRSPSSGYSPAPAPSPAYNPGAPRPPGFGNPNPTSNSKGGFGGSGQRYPNQTYPAPSIRTPQSGLRGAPAFPIEARSLGGYMRSGPGDNYPNVVALKSGTTVTLLQGTNVNVNGFSWFQVRNRSGQTGYQWGGRLCPRISPIQGAIGHCPRGYKVKSYIRNSSGQSTRLSPDHYVGLFAPSASYSGTVGNENIGSIRRYGNDLIWQDLSGQQWQLFQQPPPASGLTLMTSTNNPYFNSSDPDSQKFRFNGVGQSGSNVRRLSAFRFRGIWHYNVGTVGNQFGQRSAAPTYNPVAPPRGTRGFPQQRNPQQAYPAQGRTGPIVNPRPVQPAAQPASSRFVRFRAVVSRKCLEVDRGQTANNVGIVQFSCDGSDEQSLNLRSRAGNTFNIIAKHSGKCFDVPGGDSSDNLPLQHFDCDGSSEQFFSMRDVGGGSFNLVTNNGKCFDVPGGDTGDYVGINQFSCDGSIEQKFTLENVTS